MALISRDNPAFGTVRDFTYEHVKVKGINGKPFINFSSTSTMDFSKIDDEVCYALAKTDQLKFPQVGGVTPPLLRIKEFDAVFESQAKFEYAGPTEIVQGMSFQEVRKYLFFKKLSTLPWFIILDLKPNVFLTRTQDLYPWNSVMDLMPYTKSCIESLPFKEIGRAVIYGSWPEARVPCHRDQPSSTEFEHHINFNPGGYRQVYVYDPVDDVKTYLPEDHKLYAYNTTDYHGVEPANRFSYTIRVDGVYNDEALKLVQKY